MIQKGRWKYYTQKEVTQMLRRTHKSVTQQIIRLGLNKRKFGGRVYLTANQIEQLRKAHKPRKRKIKAEEPAMKKAVKVKHETISEALDSKIKPKKPQKPKKFTGLNILEAFQNGKEGLYFGRALGWAIYRFSGGQIYYSHKDRKSRNWSTTLVDFQQLDVQATDWEAWEPKEK